MEPRLFTKNFLLLVAGQASSLFGNYILRLSLSMYVLDMTDSAAVFAGILSASMIPAILLSPFGGILADRADKKKIMVILDALTGIFVFGAAVCISGEDDLMVIGILLMALSVLGAFETPTVQACIPQMLAGEQIISGNAVVNQVASLAYLIAPLLGSILYVTFGLKPVMYASVACFFSTAVLECFIRLEHTPRGFQGKICCMIRDDFISSIRFLTKEQPDLMKMLMLAASSRFFVMGITLVGLPYLIRSILGLDAVYYGTAESVLAVATILGSIAAGVLTGRLRPGRLSLVLAAIGVCILPAGLVFLCSCSLTIRYVVTLAAFCGMQVAISIFSIFAVSFIQQMTPAHLMGKIMAYTSMITLCAQPVGQIVYGFWFDWFSKAVYLVLIPTGVIVCMMGLLTAGVFRRLERARIL